jgi:pimeloyl-ACP methyl ester carboxylesterase
MERFRRGALVFDVTDSGPPDGPVVILLHGFPQFATSWRQVTERLSAQGFRCLAPDQRGYSAGARPRSRSAYRMPELVEDIAALAEASGAGKVHLVGHDWGAAVAWAFAARHPDRLASLSALSVPHPAAMLRAIASSRQGLASWYMYFFQLPAVPEWSMINTPGRPLAGLTAFLRKYGQSRAAAERDARAMAQPGAFRAALNWYRAMPLVNPRSADTRVGVPALYVWSDGDSAILRKTAERCADWVSGPYRFEVLPGVSHWIPDEAPATLGELLLAQFRAYPV